MNRRRTRAWNAACGSVTSALLALAACDGGTVAASDAASDRATGDVSRDSNGPATDTARVDGATTDGAGVDAASSADAGADASADGTTPLDPCVNPPGNLLISGGGFEMGMSGLAPTGWEVRNPAQPGACMGSGTLAQHVYLTDASPRCGGHALTLDSRGQWDCYAVQRVTDYNSIDAGRRYRISATLRSERNAPMGSYCPECVAAWFVMGVQWLDSADRFFGDEKNPRPANAADHDHDWQVVAWELVAPANARRVLVWLTAHYPGRVDYDNVAIVRVD